MLISFFCLSSHLIFAQGRREHFLTNGPGSASQSLGEAVVSKGVDSGAVFYNPATLVGFPSSVLFEYSQPNEGATRNWLGFCMGSSKILKVGGVWKQETLPLSSNKNAFLLSAGLSDKLIPYVPKGFNLGLTLGYVSETISNYSATSMLASLGAAYSWKTRNLSCGVGGVLKNIYFAGLKFRNDGEKEIWPVEPEIGAHVSRWGMTALVSYRAGSNSGGCVGVSYAPFKFIDFRAGYEGYPRIGLGLEIKKFRLEYTMLMGVLKNSNSMTLQYLWGKEDEKRDYTNPFQELSAKYDGMADSLLAKINSDVNTGKAPAMHDILRLIASNIKSEEGWSFWTNMTGTKKISCRIPWRKKPKRMYWEFAVAYVNESSEAKNLAEQLIKKYPGETIARLVKEILVRDLMEEQDFKRE